MIQQQRPEPARPVRALTDNQFIETIRYEGRYPTRERATVVIRTVLAAFGQQLGAGDRAELASALPPSAARQLTARSAADRSLSGGELVADIARHTPGATRATARWDTGTVLTTVARLAGPDLLARVLTGLPDGYALLFGQARLVHPRPASSPSPR
ncbi:DUF2267 domain-containing protein [Streptomyces sp. NPDC051018]|uniref:DUF2267 domain-containing protein n=1 Tax=Streptomyces sp. NPDC051018 TaxID=3365639 RepID=UPI00378F5E7C